MLNSVVYLCSFGVVESVECADKKMCIRDSQKRVMTPAQAKAEGSDYIVVGRPVTQAEDPVAAYERCVREFVD